MPGAKPIDVGNGKVCATFALDAGWLSIGTVHPRWGFVELNALPAFDESRRGDPDATRRYRMSMTDGAFAFLRLATGEGEPPIVVPDVGDPVQPRWSGRLGGASLVVEATAVPDRRSIVQRWKLDRTMTLQGRFAGRLDRPALAEITEINPPAPTGASCVLEPDGACLVVRSPELPAVARLEASAGSWHLDEGGAVLVTDGTRELVLVLTLVPGSRSNTWRPSGGHHGSPPAGQAGAPIVAAELEPPIGRLVKRALTYVRGCTALATGDRERVILTDHRVLPLSWTRDAYYQALLLLAAGETPPVADHLRWLWRRCERPDGRWVRSHHANGRRKDIAFQADQQLYPVLELADFWRAVGQLPSGVDWTGAVGLAWDAAMAEVDPSVGLIASGENAADDPAGAPYIAASQILLWYAAQRLAELCRVGALDLSEPELRRVADRTRTTFERTLVRDGRWLYATEGEGGAIAYHDANDLPVALAPLWGFCPADDPGWRSTMEFAFSAANPGYFDGDRAGLGSAHTPGPWTLGDVQAWLVARQAGDPAAANRAFERLAEVAFEDGMLPEAYSVTRDPDLRIRHWFAWPGAALAAFLILDADGLLETRLRAI